MKSPTRKIGLGSWERRSSIPAEVTEGRDGVEIKSMIDLVLVKRDMLRYGLRGEKCGLGLGGLEARN